MLVEGMDLFPPSLLLRGGNKGRKSEILWQYHMRKGFESGLESPNRAICPGNRVRAGREGVESDCLFSSCLQLSRFVQRAPPTKASFAPRR